MTARNEFQRKFGFADTGMAGDQNTHAKHIHEDPVQVDRVGEPG
jgi:hypothetical protein